MGHCNSCARCENSISWFTGRLLIIRPRAIISATCCPPLWHTLWPWGVTMFSHRALRATCLLVPLACATLGSDTIVYVDVDKRLGRRFFHTIVAVIIVGHKGLHRLSQFYMFAQASVFVRSRLAQFDFPSGRRHFGFHNCNERAEFRFWFHCLWSCCCDPLGL